MMIKSLEWLVNSLENLRFNLPPVRTAILAAAGLLAFNYVACSTSSKNAPIPQDGGSGDSGSPNDGGNRDGGTTEDGGEDGGLQCQNDYDCRYMNQFFCEDDYLKSCEGKCLGNACRTTISSLQNCNDLDGDYCREEGRKVMLEDYSCSENACVLSQATLVKDCSENDIIAVDTCTHDSDNNPFTKDRQIPFLSQCIESGTCSTGEMTITHNCDVIDCGAQCDSTHACASTECDTLDGCVGRDYHNYSDIANSCLGDCACTTNACLAPVITLNDARCTECQTDEGCNTRDRNYCAGDLVKHDEGRCIDFTCITETTTTQDCNTLDVNFCEGTQVKHKDYSCLSMACSLISTTLVQECNDDLYCNGTESCVSADCQPGTVVDCSTNNLPSISTCGYTPDSNSRTLDIASAFVSTCNESNDQCTIGSYNFTHTCDTVQCSAQCDATHACAPTECDTLDGCVGRDYHNYSDIANSCLADCACTTNACLAPVITQNDPRCTECQTDEGCNARDRNYCSGDLVKHDEGRCIDFTCTTETTTTQDCNTLDVNFCEGTQVKHKDYSCLSAACSLVSTTLVQECNDTFYCNGQESCLNATCQPGTAVDCSTNNLPSISTCGYTPDGNARTLDVAPAFTSTCNESTDQCTAGSYSFTHTCSVVDCSAQCDATHACAPTECDTLDGCVEQDYYDYSDIANSCSADCTCTTNACLNAVITLNDPRCTECQTDESCNALDRTYCAGDLLKHDEGRCGSLTCTIETTMVQDCNTLDTNFCTGTQLKHQDYSCVSTACSLVSTTLVQECDDTFYCNGMESCSGAACQSGTAVDCSANSLPAINTCSYTPDGNSRTLDIASAFVSTCNENNDQCTTGSYNFTHTCDTVQCSAQCDTTHTCAPTECDTLDGCVGRNYHDYVDIANSCLADCTCTANVCSNPVITLNDARCTECQTDEGCNTRDRNYCAGDLVKHDEGKCVDFTCTTETTTTQDCNTLDVNFCDGTQIKHKDYSCLSAACSLTSTTLVQECNDGLYCNGTESCVSADCQSGTMVDCSGNNLPTVNTCTYTPDDNSRTLDVAAAFISTCNESTDQCTTGSYAFTHACNVTQCSAQCDTTHACAPTECDTLDGCVGRDYHDYSDIANTCLADCTCTTNVCNNPVITTNDPRCTECQTDEGCNTRDRNYCAGDLVKHDEGRCIDFTCITETTTTQDCNTLDVNFCEGTQLKHKDYSCLSAACSLTSTTLVQECNDTFYCNGQESCSGAACQPGTAVDCSTNNLPSISTCGYTPDGNARTLDVAPAFTSTCNESTDQCTAGSYSFTHTCNVADCGAACDSTHPCPATPCDYLDGCYSGTYRDYYTPNACTSTCSCTTNPCGAYTEVVTDADNDNYDVECDGDCDDSDPNVHPGASEDLNSSGSCEVSDLNGKDNDCNGVIDEICLAPVPAGTFTMGCNSALYTDCEPNNPAHSVTLTYNFRIDRFEVTNTQYNRCVNAGACTPPATGTRNTAPNAPVSRISWNQAAEYCSYAGKRLLTEAEWEYSARGTDGRRFSTGDNLANCSLINYNMCVGNSTDVGSYLTGPFGTFDQSGNVHEWCRDWFAVYSGNPETNPQGPPNGIDKIFRGGHFATGETNITTYIRQGAAPSTTGRTLGFRCGKDE